MAIELVYRGGGSGAVKSVNGKIGNVVLTAEDVGALPIDTVIPGDEVYVGTIEPTDENIEIWINPEGEIDYYKLTNEDIEMITNEVINNLPDADEVSY